MRIAMVKQECNDGDKATITGTVKWVDIVKAHDGQDGTFHTQSLLVTDGEKTDDKRNSIFCGFYADKGSWEHLKNKEITVQGTINIYSNEASLRGCKLVESSQPAPQGPQQAAQSTKSRPSSPNVPDSKDRIIVAQVAAYCVKDLIVGKILTHGPQTAQAIADWTQWIMLAGQGIPVPDKRITDSQADAKEFAKQYGIPAEDQSRTDEDGRPY